MAAYHSIAVTLGQAGMVRELMGIIECMKEKPSKPAMNVHRKNWDPTLQPDIVIFNAVLNACVSSHQWKGVAWVFEQLRKFGLKANSATYGLAMEVMLHSRKYNLVHELFMKMKRSGESPKALTYKVLVRTFWEEGNVDEAIHIIRDMEQRGIVGSASVYYELACCLCNKGRWKEAMMEISKLKKLPHSKPLTFAYTGMILSSMEGGHVDDCVPIFEHMQTHCAPNIGTINAMLKVYGRNDRFLEAKELFEKIKRSVTGNRYCLDDDDTAIVPDVYTYGSMLEASGRAHQWEYFEYIYKEMCFFGYRLDQHKHAGLLVNASKAGKGHLLEHVFDTMLEAGEIPHLILFTEMVSQAMFRGDYEKAASIISAMAHAPFKLSKKDWTDLFVKNKDRISNEHLKKLSDELCNHDMPKESTVSELLKALDFACGYAALRDTFAESSSVLSSTHNKGGVEDSNIAQKLLDDDFDYGVVSMGRSNGGDDERGLPALDEAADCLAEESLFAGFGILNGYETGDSEIDDSDEPELPSADEILQSWKESRRKIGIYTSQRN